MKYSAANNFIAVLFELPERKKTFCFDLYNLIPFQTRESIDGVILGWIDGGSEVIRFATYMAFDDILVTRLLCLLGL